MSSDCKQFDAYFAGDLAAEESLRFEHHLEVCDACRDALHHNLWIDELLQSPVRLELEPAPIQLSLQVERRAPRRSRRVQLAACGLAASLLIAAGLIALTNHRNPEITHAASKEVSSTTVANRPPVPVSPPATFVSDDSTITVPLTSTASDVTVVQVYPTLETERRWHGELLLQNTQSNSNGG